MFTTSEKSHEFVVGEKLGDFSMFDDMKYECRDIRGRHSVGRPGS